jgi:hypothetical protein
MLTFHLGEVLLHFARAGFAMQRHLQHNHLSSIPELSSEQAYCLGLWQNFEQKRERDVAAVLKLTAISETRIRHHCISASSA